MKLATVTPTHCRQQMRQLHCQIKRIADPFISDILLQFEITERMGVFLFFNSSFEVSHFLFFSASAFLNAMQIGLQM